MAATTAAITLEDASLVPRRFGSLFGIAIQDLAGGESPEAMLAFSFLRNATRALKIKEQWKIDKPLQINEGGCVAPLTAEMLKTKATDLRDGRKYIGLGCLGQISNELSCAELKIDENQIEGLGRKLWATQEGTSATQQPYEGDTFWSENKVSFLAAWPEKAQLPIGIHDAGVLPKCGKFRLLALDEVVLSFWKFVGHVAAKRNRQRSHSAKLVAGLEVSPQMSGSIGMRNPPS